MSTDTNSKALALLGKGISQEAVAGALGVTPSYISQLLSDETFAGEVSKLRYEALTEHTDRDKKYDGIEDKLLTKLEKTIPLLLRPREILGALKVVNQAKRRGVDSTAGSIPNNTIVQITMPKAVIQQFTTNIHNQVVKTGDTDLLTVQSSELLKVTEDQAKKLTTTIHGEESTEDTNTDTEYNHELAML